MAWTLRDRRVYVGSTLIGKINLYASATSTGSCLLPKFTCRTGTVTVKVLTSGKNHRTRPPRHQQDVGK